MRVVEITNEPVELYKILKFEGMVGSGGEAKSVIAEGQVLVNGDKSTGSVSIDLHLIRNNKS